MLHYIYRISDQSNPKTKLENATKMHCLDNFISVFGVDNLTIIADNCLPDTVAKIKKITSKAIVTSLGNANSFVFAMDYAIEHFDRFDHVYMCEDDYLHLPEAKKILQEGLSIGNYVSLYDHPDKYVDGINPFVKDGGEMSRVLLTESCHWKTTNSTTMTFATRVGILAEDRFLFYKYCRGLDIPQDFSIFRILTGNLLCDTDSQDFNSFISNKRTIITSVPGYSTHCEPNLLSPLVDWGKC